MICQSCRQAIPDDFPDAGFVCSICKEATPIVKPTGGIDDGIPRTTVLMRFQINGKWTGCMCGKCARRAKVPPGTVFEKAYWAYPAADEIGVWRLGWN